LYDGNGTQKGKYEGYVTSIAPNEDEDEDDDEPIRPADKRTTGFGAPMAFINDIARVRIVDVEKFLVLKQSNF
jgi:splicing factor 3B subunit 1